MWVVLGLLVAAGFSFQDIFAKNLVRTHDSRLVAWGWYAFSLPWLWIVFLLTPNKTFGWDLVFLAGLDSILLTTATILYVRALQISDLSLVVPMLSFTPVFMLLTSRWMLDEMPGILGVVGIVMIAMGSYLINIRHRNIGFLEPWFRLFKDRGTRYALITALLYSIGANIDKLAVSRYSSPVWLCFLVSSTALLMGLYLLARKDFSFRPICASWRPLMILGAVFALSYLLQLAVIMMTLASYLVAVKRMSVVFSSFYGVWILRESSFKERLPGIMLMILGVILISCR